MQRDCSPPLPNFFVSKVARREAGPDNFKQALLAWPPGMLQEARARFSKPVTVRCGPASPVAWDSSAKCPPGFVARTHPRQDNFCNQSTTGATLAAQNRERFVAAVSKWLKECRLDAK